MMHNNNMKLSLGWGSRRGSATVLALMVSLLLMVLVSATMTLTVADTEMTQDYTRNRSSFEAADSGVEHGRVRLGHALSSWNLPAATTVDDVEDYAEDALDGSTTNDADISLLKDNAPYIFEVTPRNSTAVSLGWEGGDAPDTQYDVAYNITPTNVELPDPGDISARHTFHYDYQIESRGTSAIGGESNQATRQQRGEFSIQVERPSFATYGYFTNSMKNQNDQQLWFYDGEVYDGPTHVNAAPPTGQAAFWGHTVFNGPFSAVQEAYEDSVLGNGANPEFNGGASWGVDPIQVPQNGWSQLRAAVGDLDNIEVQTAPTNNELRESLGMTLDGTAVPPGVYYAPNSNAGSDLLGGVFVNGNAQQIKFSVSGNEQITQITMNNGSGPWTGTHTWEIRNNIATGAATVSLDGGTPQNFSENFNGMIHVEGAVASLKGDGTNSGDIQRDHQVTVSATGNITVSDHITYQDNPVSIPDAENILGIYSSNGNILLDDAAPSNLNLHATVMAASAGKGVGAEGIVFGGSYDYNYPDKGNWNLLGGLIEDKNQTTGVFFSDGTLTGYRWNFTYDDRFQAGVAPPYFPYVSKFVLTMMGLEDTGWNRKYY
jgi:hypothetical protein